MGGVAQHAVGGCGGLRAAVDVGGFRPLEGRTGLVEVGDGVGVVAGPGRPGDVEDAVAVLVERGELATHLANRYGTDAPAVAALITADARLAEPVVATLPYIGAEVVWAVRSEMAITLEDVLSRRTRAHLQNARSTVEAAPRVAEIMAAELGWDATLRDAQVDHMIGIISAEAASAGLPEFS